MISRLNDRDRLLTDCDRAGVWPATFISPNEAAMPGSPAESPVRRRAMNSRTGTPDVLQRVAQRVGGFGFSRMIPIQNYRCRIFAVAQQRCGGQGQRTEVGGRGQAAAPAWRPPRP